MTKDEAVFLAYHAAGMKLETLMDKYVEFIRIVENTPQYIAESDMPHAHQRALHAAIGMSTEAAEILDAFKKQLYGKNRPLSPMNMREEAGDMLFYLILFCDAFGLTLHDLVQDNLIKLANRYIEKLDT